MMQEPDDLKAIRMFILDQIKTETDPAKRAKILLDCPYYYLVAHYEDFHDNLAAIGCEIEQAYFTAVFNYMKATHAHRLNLLALIARAQTAIETVAKNEGQKT